GERLPLRHRMAGRRNSRRGQGGSRRRALPHPVVAVGLPERDRGRARRRRRCGAGARPPYQGLVALHAAVDAADHRADDRCRLRPRGHRRSGRDGPLDLPAGRAGGGDHLRLAGPRHQAAPPPAQLAAPARLLRQPPLGHAPGRGEPPARAAPAPGDRGLRRRHTATAAGHLRPVAPPDL
ncbi:MAG: hypothetical protein AVDCRST_MAG10-2371, partial [uncultured Acidimicrobiales bacterium]